MPAQEWIKGVLKDRGLKLKDAAAALRITPPRMTDILKGMREVQADEILPLAQLLGMSSKSLLNSLAASRHLTVGADDAGPALPVLGAITGTGDVLPLESDTPIQGVPLPPDAEVKEGLYCYLMGDDSLQRDIRKGSLLIAGDPRIHFLPMVPGAIFLVRIGGKGLTARKYFKSEAGEDWLVPLPEEYNPQYESLRFSMVPEELEGSRPPSSDDTETDGHKIARTDDIVAVVMWVHQRYTPETSPHT